MESRQPKREARNQVANRVRLTLTGPTAQLPPVASKYANAAAAAVLPERVVSSS